LLRVSRCCVALSQGSPRASGRQNLTDLERDNSLFRLVPGLPDRAALRGRPDHLCAGLARESLPELRQVDERAEDAEATGRARIALRELPLGLGAESLGARPGPCDEEALLGGDALARRDGAGRQGPGERPVGEPDPPEIADGRARAPLAVQMQPGLDLEGGVVVDNTRGARLERRAVGVAPPACRAPLSVEFGASGIESMREVVGEVDADATVELRVLGVGAVADGQEKAGRQDDLVELRV